MKIKIKKYETGLYLYATAEYIREATQAEIELSSAAPSGVISVDGVPCYVGY